MNLLGLENRALGILVDFVLVISCCVWVAFMILAISLNVILEVFGCLGRMLFGSRVMV